MSVYERDFYTWTQEQAKLLRQRDLDHLDVDNLLEEIESMVRLERRQLVSRLEVLLVHLLRWRHQPELRSRSGDLTIVEQRRRLQKLLRQNPGLQSHLAKSLQAYDDATFGAMCETGLPQETFSSVASYSVEQVLNGDCLPGLGQHQPW